MKISDTPSALERFRQKLQLFTQLTETDLMRFANVMHERHVNKGEVLLKEGQVCRQFYFIFRGCMRSFSIENGREANIKFYIEDDMACNFESFKKEEPSQSYLVAMEDSIVYYGIKTEVVPVLESDSTFYLFVFRFFQDLYFREEEHANTFKLLPPEERYRHLLENYPQYLQRIPISYLASYLGMSRETLTRIRKKIS
jgi:CRP-like cAMP-binding protein